MFDGWMRIRRVVVALVFVVCVGGCAGPRAEDGGGSSASGAASSPGVEASPQAFPDPSGRTDSYATIYPHFEPFEVSGSGDKTVDLPDGVWAGVVAGSFSDDGRVGVWASDVHGVPSSTLVNRTGPYSGSTAFGLDGLENVTTLTVQAEGTWVLTVSSVQDVPDLPNTGVGDGVYWNRNGQTRTVNVTFPGDSVTVMTAYPDYAWPVLKVDFLPSIDLYKPTPGSTQTQTIELDRLDSLVTVQSEGAWSIT